MCFERLKPGRSCVIYRLNLSRVKVFEWMKEIGYWDESGEKGVPHVIMSAGEVVQAAFLRGLFESEGSGS